jgi:hypothetical protein
MDNPVASYSGDPGFKYRRETEVSMLDLRVLFDPEDGSNASLWNIVELLPDYIASRPRKYYSSVVFLIPLDKP